MQQATKDKATQKAREAGEAVTLLLTQYAANAYYGTVGFEFPMQGGIIQTPHIVTKKHLPLSRE